MKILFLDQSGKLGGAELSLLDVAYPYRDRAIVGLFADGKFRHELEQRQIPVRVLTQQPLEIRKDSSFWQSLQRLGQLLPLIWQTIQLSRTHDLIYTNTQKAFVVGAIVRLFTGRPLVHHLRDILSTDHFSPANLRVVIALANQCATRIICNSQATREAFIAAGGRADLATVIYNGFDPAAYQQPLPDRAQLRQMLGVDDRFVIGHFSRLSPWKGQHILLSALPHCAANVTVLLVGDALFGEQAYVAQLQQQVVELGLGDRVQFLGFRPDVAALMAACDLIAHTSTAPEPFGRVIVEAMLCGTPVVAAAAGGAVELVQPDKTGWLVPPADPVALAAVINQCQSEPQTARTIAQAAQTSAHQNFHLDQLNQQIQQVLTQILHPVA